jgi:hypothetical protein
VRDVKTIASGRGIRDLKRLKKQHGVGNWKKKKGIARILKDGKICVAEIHWYEAHGIGKKEFKTRRVLSVLQ